MIISPIELEILVSNSRLNDELRSRLGDALLTAIYDPERGYTDRFEPLADPTVYVCPSDDILLLCANYLQHYTAGMLLDVDLIAHPRYNA